MKTVVGLFESQVSAEQAIEALMDEELDRELMVVHLGEQGVLQEQGLEKGADYLRSAAGRGIAGVFPAPTREIRSGPSIRRLKHAHVGEITHTLLNGGFRSVEARFLSDSVQRGSTLLVLESTDQDLAAVEDVLDQGQVLVR